MTPRKPMTEWQAATLPEVIPLHLRRNIAAGDGDCWLWTRSLSSDGYGWASLNDRTHQAHRLVYRLVLGEPPTGMHLDHLCRVRRCVNPAHLEPVTPRENLARGDTPTGWTHCQKCGSEYGTHKRGQRRCRPCEREYHAISARAWRARRKAEASR